MPDETRFYLLVPWSATPTEWHPTERTGPFAVLTRGSYPTAAECHVWARDHLRGAPYIVREIRTDDDDHEDKIDRPSHLFPVLHDGTPRAFTDLGGYPLIYVTRCGEVLCAACAHASTDDSDPIVASDVYWEGAPEYCAECNAEIESAYGDPDLDDEDNHDGRA